MSERRQHSRIKKSFMLSYYEKGSPLAKRDITQLKDISLGGMCFLTAEKHEPSAKLGVELRVPYFVAPIVIEGTVLESREKIPNLSYETHLIFDNLTPQAESALKELQKLSGGK